MTGKSDGSGKRPEKGPDTGATSRRPYATIDMKATEIKASDDAAKGASSAPASGTSSTSSAASSSASGPAGGSGSQREAAEKVAAAAASVSKAADTKAAEAAKSSDPKATSAASGAARPSTSATSGATPPPAARQGSGFGRFVSHAAAGVVGGVLALLGAQHLAPELLGGQSTKVAVAPEVASRLAALEKAQSTGGVRLPDDVAKRLQSLEAAAQRTTQLPDALGGLAKAHEQLAARAKELEGALARQGAGGDAAVRIAKLEERLSALAAAALTEPSQAGRIPQLAQLTGKIGDLETALTNRLAALRKDTAQEIESRLSAVAEAAEAARSGTQRIDREVTGVKSETTRLTQRVDQVKTGTDRLDQAVKGLSDTATALKDALEATRTDLVAQIKAAARPADVSSAVAPVNARVAALESSVQSVVKAEDNRRANAERIVLSIELGNLKRAMDRGQGYAAELTEVRKIAGTRFDLTALDRYKGEGVLTLADLARELRPLAHQIIAADSEPGDAGVVDRLLTGARSIVRVRKTSPDSDDKSVEATVARIERAVKDGRLGDVLSLAKTLSPKAARPAQDWLRKVEARQSVEAALATIDAQLKTSLGGPAATTQGSKQ